MKPFRYTADMFATEDGVKHISYDAREWAAHIANALLEDHEKKCEKVWGQMEYDTGVMIYFDDKDAWPFYLWNPQPLVAEPNSEGSQPKAGMQPVGEGE